MHKVLHIVVEGVVVAASNGVAVVGGVPDVNVGFFDVEVDAFVLIVSVGHLWIIVFVSTFVCFILCAAVFVLVGHVIFVAVVVAMIVVVGGIVVTLAVVAVVGIVDVVAVVGFFGYCLCFRFLFGCSDLDR